ncbi:MAG: hypothetical protein RI955_223 [Bacteroidota bacterium]|jgi:hypothetical protein
MLHFITKIKEVKPYRIVCLFNTNETRTIDFMPMINEFKITSPNFLGKLSDINYFNSVELDSYGTLSWHNEIDFCPDVLYAQSQPA